MSSTPETCAPVSYGGRRALPRGRPKADLTLSEAERQVLERWSLRSKTTRAVAVRARIILRSAEGAANSAIAEEMRVTPRMVGKWRARFIERGLDGLLDEPKPGATRSVPDAAIERLVAMTLESAPHGAARWSTRSMAKALGLTQSTVSRVWRAFSLQPRRNRIFELADGPPFVEGTREIVGLFLDPPDSAVAFRLDAGADQASDHAGPLPSTRTGEAERRARVDTRNGTASLLAPLQTAMGRIVGTRNRGQRSVELRHFLDRVDEAVPADRDVLLVLDNDGTAKFTLIRSWLARRPRFHVRFSPAGDSGPALVERCLDPAGGDPLRRGPCRTIRALEAAIRRHVEARDGDGPFVWTASTAPSFQTFGELRSGTAGSEN